MNTLIARDKVGAKQLEALQRAIRFRLYMFGFCGALKKVGQGHFLVSAWSPRYLDRWS
jgi:cobalamin biosynthesis protein CbiD